MFFMKGPCLAKTMRGANVGTGSAQLITHNLGTTPDVVIIVPEASCAAVPFWTPGSTTKSVLSVTVSAGVPYTVFAGFSK